MAQKYKDTIDCLIKELDSSAIKSCLFQSEKNNSTYKVRTISVDKRIEADKDYSSIIQSGYFRRLEDKTQVFALAKDNHRRTRLTHSIEVSSVGEQLGNNCIDIIRRSYLVGYKGKERDSLIKIINTIPLILRND